MIRALVSRALVIACATSSVARADADMDPTDAADDVHWLTYAAFRNDVFTELDPPIDDQGFTHDNEFSLRRQRGTYTVGGSFLHRFITSRTSDRRWDLVELFATGERAWPDLFDTEWPRVTTTERIGLALGGNFGGRYLQNGFHAVTGTGPTLDQGLQSRYDGDRELGVVVGGGARAEVGDQLQGYAVLDGQAAVGGTGVTSFEAMLGGAAWTRHVGAHVEVALSRYFVGDRNLALEGGYRTGFQLEWRAGVDVRWSRFRIGFQYRGNESGSGEPMGVLWFASRR
jgi:hypothetical protein